MNEWYTLNDDGVIRKQNCWNPNNSHVYAWTPTKFKNRGGGNLQKSFTGRYIMLFSLGDYLSVHVHGPILRPSFKIKENYINIISRSVFSQTYRCCTCNILRLFPVLSISCELLRILSSLPLLPTENFSH